MAAELVVGGWFASAAIAKLIEKLIIYISGQYEYRKDVRPMLEELKRHLTVLGDIKGDLDGALIEDRRLQLRLVELKEAVYEAEDLLYRSEYQVLSSNSPTETSIKRLFFADKDINDLLKVADSFKTIVSNIGDFSSLPKHHPGVSEFRQTSSFPTASQLLGRGKGKARLLKLLTTDDDGRSTSPSPSNFSIIAIVGMGGLGKTALAQNVFHDIDTRNWFNLKVWVYVSQTFDLMKIIKEILSELDPINRLASSHTIGSLGWNQDILSKGLMGRRFLIVLDDVWNLTSGQLQKLCAPFRNAMKGSRFILTTRNHGLVRRLGAIKTVSLDEMLERPYSELFKRCAFGLANPAQYPALASIGTEIANKLNGSPLAAETVGAELRSKLNARHWSNVLDSRLCDIKQGGDGIIPSLRLTYMHLPATLKQCFAFAALFPPNCVFERQSLVRMWIAQGFVQSSGNKSVEDTGMDYFDELLDISFFQRAEQKKKNRYVINALLHEVAWFISKTEYCVVDNKKPVHIPEKLRHLCVVGNTLPEVCKDKYTMKRLRSLVLFGDFHFDKNDLKMFRKLKSLRLLIIWGCKRKLPSTIIDNLKHLPYLDISAEAVSIRALRELLEFIVNRNDGHEIGQLRELNELRGRLNIRCLEEVLGGEKEATEAMLCNKEHLNALRLEWSVDLQGDVNPPDCEGVLEGLKPHSKLQRLEIAGYGGKNSPSWLMDRWLSKLTDIRLENCKFWEDLPSLGQLPKLRVLHLTGLHGVKKIVSKFYGDERFPSLQELSFRDMGEWKVWSQVEGRPLFRHLSKLSITGCPNLKGPLPLKHLSSLKTLQITGCPKINLNPELGLPTSLKQLFIHECHPQLAQQCRNKQGRNWQQISTIPHVRILDSHSNVVYECSPSGTSDAWNGWFIALALIIVIYLLSGRGNSSSKTLNDSQARKGSEGQSNNYFVLMFLAVVIFFSLGCGNSSSNTHRGSPRQESGVGTTRVARPPDYKGQSR